MRISYSGIGLELNCEEEKIVTLVIESTEIFRKMVHDMWNQINGYDGDWTVFRDGTTAKLQKEAEIIFNPFAVDINDKKILSALYKELVVAYEHEFTDRIGVVQSDIITLMDEMEERSPYPLIYNDNVNLEFFLKNLGVCIDLDYQNEIEHFIDYMILKSKICHTDLFILVNPRQFFNEIELSNLYKMCIYDKIRIITLQPILDKWLEYEKVIILDKDLCSISLD